MKMDKIINPYLKHEGYNCIGCSPNNPIGLHLDFYEDGDDIVSMWSPSQNYQGWLNTLHGGIIATLMDETAGWVITRKLQTTGVTSRLNIHYKKPVYTTDKLLTIRARIASKIRNYYTIQVELTNDKGELCDEADAIYYVQSQDKAKEIGFPGCKVEGE